MNTYFRSSFDRDLKKIIDPVLREEVKQAILSVENAQAKKDIPELKKYKGNKKGIFYRIKVGSYRIGVTIENNVVEFVAFKPRKDFNKSFPHNYRNIFGKN